MAGWRVGWLAGQATSPLHLHRLPFYFVDTWKSPVFKFFMKSISPSLYIHQGSSYFSHQTFGLVSLFLFYESSITDLLILGHPSSISHYRSPFLPQSTFSLSLTRHSSFDNHFSYFRCLSLSLFPQQVSKHSWPTFLSSLVPSPELLRLPLVLLLPRPPLC